MKVVYYVNGVLTETILDNADFRTAANRIRQEAPNYLGSGYDSQGNGFVSADGTKELRLEED